MSSTSDFLPERLHRYLLDYGVRESALLRRLREETAADPMARMQIAAEQGQFMRMLVQLMGARRAIELGVFTGYSSLCVASALPGDGELIACDISREWTDIARRYWKEAGVDERISLRLAPATETLDALLRDGQQGTFDFAFMDADKENYLPYYARLLELIRPGGLIVVDNVFWSGAVMDESVKDIETMAIRAFNQFVADDERVDISMVPVADGLTLLRRRA